MSNIHKSFALYYGDCLSNREREGMYRNEKDGREGRGKGSGEGKEVER